MKPVGASKKKGAKTKASTSSASSESAKTKAKAESATTSKSSIGVDAPDLSVSSSKDGPGTALIGAAPTPRDPGLEERRVGQAATVGAVLVVTGAIGSGLIFGPATAVLVLAAGAFVAVIALFWSSLRTLLGETPLSGADAYAIGAARAEEEQKRAVLRALKDLEFERSVGKISEDDYRRLVTHYRAEAKRLLRILDEESQPMRDRADALIATRLAKAGLSQGAAAIFREPAKSPGERAVELAQEEASRELREAALDREPDAETESALDAKAALDTAVDTKASVDDPSSADGEPNAIAKADLEELSEEKVEAEAETTSTKEAHHE